MFAKVQFCLWASLRSSVGKESACDAGDLGSIPGSRRYPGEGNGNSLQCSSLENSMARRAWQAIVHGVAKVGHDLATKPPPIVAKTLFLYSEDVFVSSIFCLLCPFVSSAAELSKSNASSGIRSSATWGQWSCFSGIFYAGWFSKNAVSVGQTSSGVLNWDVDPGWEKNIEKKKERDDSARDKQRYPRHTGTPEEGQPRAHPSFPHRNNLSFHCHWAKELLSIRESAWRDGVHESFPWSWWHVFE